MPYAVQQDIINLYGNQQFLLVSDRDGDGVTDQVSGVYIADTALQGASDEIDSYLSNRYQMPLPTVSPVLRDKCCDIAMYRMAVSGDVMTDDRRSRYKDALKWLEGVAAGTIDIGVPQDTQSKSGGPDVTYQPRIFTRGNKIL